MDVETYVVLFIALVIWIGPSLIAGVIAKKKGRSGFGFFLLSIFISPLIGIIAALIVMPDERKCLNQGRIKKCPYCCEIIKADAILCKHCKQSVASNKHSQNVDANGMTCS